MTDEMENHIIDFGPVDDLAQGIIKVVGVGGGGCNAVKSMYMDGIEGVTFAVCNTDSNTLSRSPVPVKVPLGNSGLGAGANPSVGKTAAEESRSLIENVLNDGTKMVFITAGMGGGTGTGAAPVVAEIAQDMGLLTVGIVTIPFSFEKKPKIIKALKGIEQLRKHVDALLIINNEHISRIYSNSDLSVTEAFRKADSIVATATRSISELITREGTINLDFRDVETTLRGGGGAIMAIGTGRGSHRVEKALVDAIDSPLLCGADMGNAKRVLLNIHSSSAHELKIKELHDLDVFMKSINAESEVIWGLGIDDSLGEEVKVTVLATGFDDIIVDEHVSYSAKDSIEHYNYLISQLYRNGKDSPAPLEERDLDFLEEYEDDTPNTVVLYEEHDTEEVPADDAEERTADDTEEEPIDDVFGVGNVDFPSEADETPLTQDERLSQEVDGEEEYGMTPSQEYSPDEEKDAEDDASTTEETALDKAEPELEEESHEPQMVSMKEDDDIPFIITRGNTIADELSDKDEEPAGKKKPFTVSPFWKESASAISSIHVPKWALGKSSAEDAKNKDGKPERMTGEEKPATTNDRHGINSTLIEKPLSINAEHNKKDNGKKNENASSGHHNGRMSFLQRAKMMMEKLSAEINEMDDEEDMDG